MENDQSRNSFNQRNYNSSLTSISKLKCAMNPFKLGGDEGGSQGNKIPRPFSHKTKSNINF